MHSSAAPPKAYIDTNHLVNISRLRLGDSMSPAQRDAYRALDQALRQGRVGLIYSMPAALEWVEGNATRDSAKRIAAVVDSAQVRYFFEGDHFVFLHELLKEVARIEPALIVPSVPILQAVQDGDAITTALGTLAASCPSWVDPSYLPQNLTDATQVPRDIPYLSASQLVDEAIRYQSKHTDRCQERIDGYEAALTHDCTARSSGMISPSDFVAWAKRFLRIDRIIHAADRTVDVDDLLSKIDLAHCPGTKLWWDARVKRIRAGHPPRSNDVDDWIFLPLVPHCDVVLTDGAHRECIVQGDRSLKQRVFADPREAVSALQSATAVAPKISRALGRAWSGLRAVWAAIRRLISKCAEILRLQRS